MTDIMSYQYPPPPHSGGSDMSLHTPGYHHHMSASFAAMPHAATASLAAVTSATAAPPVTSTTIAAAASISSSSSAAGLGQDPHISPKQRRESLSRSSSVNMKLKRSLSTPVVRPQQANMSQAQAMPSPDHSALGLAAEKRRNKLGYHRTSVACGTLSKNDRVEGMRNETYESANAPQATAGGARFVAFHHQPTSRAAASTASASKRSAASTLSTSSRHQTRGRTLLLAAR